MGTMLLTRFLVPYAWLAGLLCGGGNPTYILLQPNRGTE